MYSCISLCFPRLPTVIPFDQIIYTQKRGKSKVGNRTMHEASGVSCSPDTWLGRALRFTSFYTKKTKPVLMILLYIPVLSFIPL